MALCLNQRILQYLHCHRYHRFLIYLQRLHHLQHHHHRRLRCDLFRLHLVLLVNWMLPSLCLPLLYRLNFYLLLRLNLRLLLLLSRKNLFLRPWLHRRHHPNLNRVEVLRYHLLRPRILLNFFHYGHLLHHLPMLHHLRHRLLR